MENENVNPEQDRYQPRPAWQVWAARIGLVLFLAFVVWQIFHMAGGGL